MAKRKMAARLHRGSVVVSSVNVYALSKDVFWIVIDNVSKRSDVSVSYDPALNHRSRELEVTFHPTDETLRTDKRFSRRPTTVTIGSFPLHCTRYMLSWNKYGCTIIVHAEAEAKDRLLQWSPRGNRKT